MNKQHLTGHATMLVASIMWGLAAPIGKVVMNNGMNGLQLVSLRIGGAAACFWMASLFVKKEKVPARDLLRLCLAGLLAIGINQPLFTVGLNLTSPINATIISTMMPIATMLLAFVFLREPITWKKVLGIALGATGAVTIVLASAGATGAEEGNAVGDLIILTAQFCFACYLTAFKSVIHRYSGVTCMKWMFLFSLIFVVPFTATSFRSFEWSGHDAAFWGGTAYVVLGATFITYLLLMKAQHELRPTVVSIYNYVQPIVACLVSVATGLALFGWSEALSVVLVFSGVWLVTQSKSRRDQLAQEAQKKMGNSHKQI